MKRSELEHIIRAAGAIAGEKEIVIIGSQAILGQFPDAAGLLIRSAEADVFPLHHPHKSERIDGAIGEGSRFHEQFGYYAQGVDEHTAVLPEGWRARLIRVENENTDGNVGLCLEVHDLAISKYIAGRPKDLEFTAELARHQMTGPATLLERLVDTTHEYLGPDLRRLIEARIRRDFP
jgi:hypothetical protein